MLIPYPTFLYCSGLSSIWTFSESCYQFSLTFLLAKKGILFFIEQCLIFIVVIEMVFVVILEMFFARINVIRAYIPHRKCQVKTYSSH